MLFLNQNATLLSLAQQQNDLSHMCPNMSLSLGVADITFIICMLLNIAFGRGEWDMNVGWILLSESLEKPLETFIMPF